MTGPLQSKRIVVTRAREQAEELCAKLRTLGADPLVWPMIEIAPPEDDSGLKDAAAQLARFDWVVFSSANGVKALCDKLEPGLPSVPRIAAVGERTAGSLRRYGLHADAVPAEFLASEITGALGDIAGLSILVVRPDIASPALAEALRARGAIVREVIAYRTRGAPVEEPLALDGVDAVTFASGSAATQFARRLQGQTLPAHLCIACIGPSTAQAARAAGLPVAVVAGEHTLDGLVSALVAYYTREVVP